MKKKTYIAPAMLCHEMELLQMIANSPINADGVVKDGNDGTTKAGFRTGEAEDGDQADSKHGNFNPWTAWDDLPTWE